jgi:hypothetical protein
MGLTKKIDEILRAVEDEVLDGLKFPGGKPANLEESERKIEFAAPKIVEAYDLSCRSLLGVPALRKRIYYLARNFRKEKQHVPYSHTETELKDLALSERLREIAMEGRRLAIEKPSEMHRIKLRQLFRKREDVFAAQIRDSKRGCSASICSNCDEPIAYCHYTCRVCNYELIGASHMPEIEKWDKMDLDEKWFALDNGYDYMIADIRQRGDWRGKESPLNRFKPDNSRWGGYSTVSGGAPLTRM